MTTTTEATHVSKIAAGSAMPRLNVSAIDGTHRDLSKPRGEADWMMLVIYRGEHCNICTGYLKSLSKHIPKLNSMGIDVAAVSADSREQLETHVGEKLGDIDVPLYCGLSISQMKQLGLYVSNPRDENETDHPFSEPALMVIDDEGVVRIADIANAPFIRPNLDILVKGLEYIRQPDMNYPIRGAFTFDSPRKSAGGAIPS